jgi:hypothetical protein
MCCSFVLAPRGAAVERAFALGARCRLSSSRVMERSRPRPCGVGVVVVAVAVGYVGDPAEVGAHL